MVDETNNVWNIAEDKSITMRTAAYVHALKRLEEAVTVRGTKDFFMGNQ
jgi:glutamate dehydrogenase (NADP+)